MIKLNIKNVCLCNHLLFILVFFADLVDVVIVFYFRFKFHCVLHCIVKYDIVLILIRHNSE